MAVPSGAIADALGKVRGIEGKTTIDATNAVRSRNEEFDSNAHEIKSIVGGPTAKSFNLNFARIYDEIGAQRVPPSNLYCADDEARKLTEQLIRDAGYDPVNAGGLEQARLLDGPLVEVVEVTTPWAHLAMAVEFYGQRIRGLQLVHADKRERWPWDDAYQGVRGGQPVLGPREPPERRKRVA